MFIVSLSDDWDVTVAEWQVETEKEAENLKAYIEQKIKKLGLEYKYYGGCEIHEPMEGNNKEVDEYFDKVLTEIEEEKEQKVIANTFISIDENYIPKEKNIEICVIMKFKG